MDLLRRDPVASALYLPDGAPAKPESFRPLPALTATLKTLAAEGPRAFYEGTLADSIAADLRSGGSRITTDDLAAYAAEEPEPLTGPHRGAELPRSAERPVGKEGVRTCRSRWATVRSKTNANRDTNAHTKPN